MSEPTDADSSTRRAHRPTPSNDRSRLALIVVAVIAVVAVGLAAWALVRPAKTSSSADSATPTYTDAQRADSKAKICTAFNTVRTGVSQNTNLVPPGGPDDVTGALAVAANARLSLYDGGQYLLARLDPSTAPELADAVRAFGNTLMDIGAASTAGAQNSDPQQAGRLRDADAANTTITNLCK
ncbi:hypothetical protein [Mycolicibacterium komossense]|uniref:hypothetical protein n=1 Tax=Mycolicibacterium komossense TaxID=1779 RepID=UPI0021F28EB7|nr:hypothetical protein [Mycolicibacterium komossense]